MTGYIPALDQEPGDLPFSRPCCRVAVVTETYDPTVPGHFAINSDLLTRLVSALRRDAELEIRFGSNPHRTARNPGAEELHEIIADDLFDSITIFKERVPWIQLRGAQWYKCGGPKPYHDSATVEIFAAKADCGDVTRLVHGALVSMVTRVDVIAGKPIPTPAHWWVRLKSLLK